MKINIGVFFGGDSLEHDLSILTAIQAMENIDKERYEVIPIYITKDLKMYSGGMLKYIDSYKDFNLIKRYAKRVNLVNKNGKFILENTGLIRREYKELHLAFPMVHGKNTEDGSLVGYLKIIGIPTIGNDIYASAICQDKVFTKEVLKANKLPVTDYVHFNDIDYKNDKEEIFKKIDKLSYPLVIKPARLGSGIGIEIVTRKEELESSVEKVMERDSRILVEEYIKDRSEYNMAILSTKGKLLGSNIEEIVKDGICSYYDKYRKDDDNDDTFKRIYPAKISKALTQEIEKVSKEVYKVLSLEGTVRIDYIYDNKAKKLYINEVNTVPNFFSHHLFEERNIDYRELLGIMIKQAIDKIHKEENMIKTFNDESFKNVTSKALREMK